MSVLFIVEDDQGIVDKFIVAEYENVGEAQVAAIDSVIEWFEDMDNHDQFTDMIDVANDIKTLEQYKDGVKDGQFDEEDEFEVSGFKIKSL
jgi:hypothetical protein